MPCRIGTSERDGTFHSQGVALKANLRARPTERFLVVASDASTVGMNVSQITNATQTAAFASRRAVVVVQTGSERTVTQTYAHNGAIVVRAEPVPVLSPPPR